IETTKEDIKANKEKIKLYKQLPYLVANVVERGGLIKRAIQVEDVCISRQGLGCCIFPTITYGLITNGIKTPFTIMSPGYLFRFSYVELWQESWRRPKGIDSRVRWKLKGVTSYPMASRNL
ncbi:hypothetical protein MKW92_031246, partial [Papaver armeniacum]